MKEQTSSETDLRKYLLNELTERERAQVEERLFLDTEFFLQLEAEEDDLIDEYAGHELSPEETKRFESYFLSDPERHADVRLAKALKKYVAEHALLEPHAFEENESKRVEHSISEKMPFWASLKHRAFSLRFALAVAAILLITLGGIWLIYKNRRQVNQPNEAHLPQPPAGQDEQQELNRNEEKQARGDEQETQNQSDVGDTTGANRGVNRVTNSTLPRRPPTPIYSFFLLPGGGVRGNEETTLVHLPPLAGSVVDLKLPLTTETSYKNFRATLHNQKGVTVEQWSHLKSSLYKSVRVVSVKVPVKRFDQQRYSVELMGVDHNGKTEILNNYLFQIVK
jgi:hypothetical protein